MILSDYTVCKTPVLLLLFNRPKRTEKLISALRIVKPSKIYVVADGPRENRPLDKVKCAEVKSQIELIDWSCEIKKLYRNENLGCAQSVSTGINWFFDQEKEGIILEDDCFPNKSFFMFCEYHLNKYRNNDAIMHISGNNFQFGHQRSSGSYYFSRHTYVWGWATWRRAWKFFDLKIKPKTYEKIKNKKGFNTLPQNLIKYSMRQLIDSWAVPWLVSIFKQGGLSIVPEKNLVMNTGFSEGTHMKDGAPYYYKYINHGSIKKIKDPSPLKIKPNVEADRYANKILYSYNRLNKLKNEIKLLLLSRKLKD